MFSRFIPIVESGFLFSLIINVYNLYIILIIIYNYIYNSHIYNSYIYVRHLGSLNILVIMNNLEVHMGVQIPLQDPGLISTGYICRYGIAESYGSSTFKFWKNHHIVF